MSARPTKFYPSPPVLKDFHYRPTNVKVAAAVDSNTPGGSLALSHMRTDYQACDEAVYAQYLAAHTIWIDRVHAVDNQLHEYALRRRALEKFKEVITLDVESEHAVRDNIEIPHYFDNNPDGDNTVPATFNITLERKVPTPPTLSTKPHQAEKREKKKELAAQRTKVKANALEARRELAAAQTVPVLKAQLAEVKKVTQVAALRKVELVAAKSAASRALQIQKSSPDLVTEVVPDDGWKLVTRRKGDRSSILATTTKMGAAGTQLHHATVVGDHTIVKQPGKLLAATTRAPTSTAAR